MARVAPQPSSLPLKEEGQRGSLADYNIEKKIGKGQFSCVYRATRIADGQTVALKKVPVTLVKKTQYRLPK